MGKDSFRATGVASLAPVLAAWLVVIGGPLPASAAERTVLCEEFTNVG